MNFHRLNANPAGYDALPGGYDFINNPAANGDAGVPAAHDGKKSGGPNSGTYYVGFGEDATSSDTNRGMQALAENTDWLDNVVRKPLAMPTRTTNATAVGAVSSVILPDTSGVYLGTTGGDSIPETLLTLFSVLDASDNEVLDPTSGVRCDVTAITGGTVGTGFSSGAITLTINPAIPNGTTYRVYYANKSNLLNMPTDALTVIKIRGAQELPAGFEDFQKQITRYVGSSVVALVATMIETPDGSRLTKSNSMSFEVDPDGSVGATHRFFWRKARDVGGALTMFEVNDDTSLGGVAVGRVRLALGYVLEAVGTGLMRDANIAGGAGSGGAFVPWTSATAAQGDQYLRVFEKGFVGSAVTAPTLFRALNGRWTVTCGDGSNSFGDFNGADAIQQALAYIAAVAATAAINIKLKKGTFVISDGNGVLAFGSGTDVSIEGIGPTDTIISCTSTAAPISAASSGYIRLKNLKIIRASGSTTGLTNVSALCLYAENCWFNNFSFLLLDPSASSLSGVVAARNAVHMKECRFETNALGVCPLTMQFGSNLATYAGYLFEDCIFYVNDSAVPAVRIQAKTAMAANATARGFRFERTVFHLGSTGVTGGNPNGACGPLDIKSNGTTFGSNGLRLVDITFNECNVYAGSAKSSDATVQLLYITPYDGSGIVEVDNLTIQGGKWLIMKNSPSLLPWWVGSALDYFTGAPNHNPNFFHMRDVTTGWVDAGDYSGSGTSATTTYGVAPTAFNTSLIASVDQPAYYFNTVNLELKNIIYVGACGSSTEADMWLNSAVSIDVDNLQLTIANGIAALKPNYRIKISPNLTTIGGWTPVRRIRGLFLNGNNIAALNTLATVQSAALIVIPGGHLEMESCQVSNFTSGISSMAGLIIPMADGAFGFTTNLQVAGLKVRNGKFNGNHNAGFQVFHDASASLTVSKVSGLEISGCTFIGNSTNGLALYGNDGTTSCSFPDLMVRGNTAYDNSNANPQMLIYPSAFKQLGSISITNNSAGSTTGVNPKGIAFGTFKATLAANELLGAAITGNTCWSGADATGYGWFGLRKPGGGAINWDESANLTLQKVRGVNTAFITVAGTIYRAFTDAGAEMMDNDALLASMP